MLKMEQEIKTSPLQEASIAWAKFIQEHLSKLNRMDQEVCVQMIKKSLGEQRKSLDVETDIYQPRED